MFYDTSTSKPKQKCVNCVCANNFYAGSCNKLCTLMHYDKSFIRVHVSKQQHQPSGKKTSYNLLMLGPPKNKTCTQ